MSGRPETLPEIAPDIFISGMRVDAGQCVVESGGAIPLVEVFASCAPHHILEQSGFTQRKIGGYRE
jgi:hypothetical protein